MPPTATDVTFARGVAARIVAAGQDRVRRVVMIGSRALGRARPNSDLDLLVLVELPAGAAPWGSAECIAERERIVRQLPRCPLKVELWVRTMEQYAECRRVECSLDWRVEAEGVEVYQRPVERGSIARRPDWMVRRENAFGWIAHAVRALDAAVALANSAAFQSSDTQLTVVEQSQHPARSAAVRAITALLVMHRIHASKHDELDFMLTRLAAKAPECAGRIRARLKSPRLTARDAYGVVQEVVRELSRDDQWASALSPIRSRLAQPTVFFTPSSPMLGAHGTPI